MTDINPHTATRLHWTAVLLLTLQPVLFFFRVLIAKHEHIPYDLVGFHLPLIAYIGRCFREGVFPFWDPYQHCGMPIYADLQAQLWYPPMWIAILLGNLKRGVTLLYWLEWVTALHMILAGILLFLLLRRMGCSPASALLGGTAYQLGAFFASQTQHLGAVSAGAWLPLVAWCEWELREKFRLRWFCLLTLAYALSILAGFAAGTFVVVAAGFLFALALWITRRASRALLASITAAGVAALLISAVQLVPTWLLSRESIAVDRLKWFVNGGGLPWQSLVSFVIPNYYHLFTPFDKTLYRAPFNFTFLYVYCGALTAALFFVAPFRRSLWARAGFALSLISVVWMLGEHAYVYTFFYRSSPVQLRGALYAEDALMAFTFFAAFTAAHSLQSMGRRVPQWALWAVALLTAADLLWVSSDRPMNAEPPGYEAQNSEYHVVDLGRLDDELRSLTSGTAPPERVDYLDDIFFAGVLGAEMIRVPTPDGDNPFTLKRFLDLRRVFAVGDPWDRRLSVTQLDSPLLDLLNVRYLVGRAELSPADLERGHMTLQGQFGATRVYRRGTTLPRFFVVNRTRSARSRQEALALVSSPGFRPAEEAVVEDAPALTGGAAQGTVRVDRYEKNWLELTASTSTAGVLVTSETMYRGWHAYIDGHEVRLLTVNAAFRGLALPPGTSHIRMTYAPAGYWALAWLSGALALATLGGAVFAK